MSLGFAGALFVGSLVLTIVSSMVLAEVVDRLGQRLGLSETVFGILTALAADAPEISAAVTAIQGQRSGLGFGVVIGSSVFNIAALLALSAVIAGTVRIRRRALIFQGAVALAATALATVTVLQLWAPVLALMMFLVLFAAYVALSALKPDRLDRLAVPRSVRRFLVAALTSVEKDSRPGRTPPPANRHDLLTLLPALAAVVLGSIGLVQTSVRIGALVHISQVIIGTVVLAALTGMPNVLAAVRLARRQRGSAVVSEALNSNTINLLLGLTLPAVIAGIGSPIQDTVLSVWWLVAITTVTLGFTAYQGGLRRREGVAVIVLYGVFVGTLVGV